MGLIGGISFVAGMVFVLVGAWPVMGFLGLDVLLIWLAFRMSYRAGRQQQERILITRDGELQVMQKTRRGDRIWRFRAYWCRADVETDRRGARRLYIGNQERRIRIGAFLPEDELVPLSQAVNAALRQG